MSNINSTLEKLDKAGRFISEISGGYAGQKSHDKVVEESRRQRGKGLPVPPTVPPPVVMPLPNDDAVRRARIRSYAKQRQRSGRASTILSDATDTLG